MAINTSPAYYTSKVKEVTLNFESDSRLFYEGVDVTEIVQEKVDAIKEEALRREAAKPKPKPEDPIVNVDFNMDLERTTIKWKDGTITQLHCCALDEFDKEKAIALCFMKKMYDNRGCFNDFLEYWVDNASIH